MIANATAPERVVVMHLEGLDSTSVITALVSLASGAFGLEVFKRWAQRRQDKEAGEVTITARILDKGDALQQTLLEEARVARQESAIVLQRAHAAELAGATKDAQLENLRMRLARKDEQIAALLRHLGAPGNPEALIPEAFWDEPTPPPAPLPSPLVVKP